MRQFEHYGHHDGWVWIFPGITMVLLWIVLIAVLALLWRAWSHRTGPAAPWRGPGSAPAPAPRPAAEQILADRLARGEIDVDDYRQRLAVLRGGPDPGSAAPPPPPPSPPSPPSPPAG